MQWVLHQPEGRAAEGFQRVLERHGAEAPMRFGERETQQIGPHRVGRRLSGQSIAAAAEHVLDGLAYRSDPGGKLHCDHGVQQVRLRFRRSGADTCVAPHLCGPGEQIGRARQAEGPEEDSGSRLRDATPR